VTHRSAAYITNKEETNVLRISEQKIIRKICRPILGGKCWRIRKNELKEMLQGQIL